MWRAVGGQAEQRAGPRRNRVVAAAAKRMAACQAVQCHVRSRHRPMHFQRLQGVRRTGGLKTARIAQPGAQQKPVAAHQRHQRALRQRRQKGPVDVHCLKRCPCRISCRRRGALRAPATVRAQSARRLSTRPTRRSNRPRDRMALASGSPTARAPAHQNVLTPPPGFAA